MGKHKEVIKDLAQLLRNHGFIARDDCQVVSPLDIKRINPKKYFDNSVLDWHTPEATLAWILAGFKRWKKGKLRIGLEYSASSKLGDEVRKLDSFDFLDFAFVISTIYGFHEYYPNLRIFTQSEFEKWLSKFDEWFDESVKFRCPKCGAIAKFSKLGNEIYCSNYFQCEESRWSWDLDFYL